MEHPNGTIPARVRAAGDRLGALHAVPQWWLGVFDKDNDRMVFQYVPFADHNAMLDPATVDITGRILEMLAAYGYDKNHQAVKQSDRVLPQRAGSRMAPGLAAGE